MQSDLIKYSISAKISLLPTELGGRKKSILTGYKPAFAFNTSNHYSGEIRLVGRKELRPGDSASVVIRLLPARTIRKTLKPNDAFIIAEGSKTIGSGIIEKVRVLPDQSKKEHVTS